MELREKVLKKLEESELSIAEIARRGDIHQNTIYSFRSGRSKNLKMNQLKKVCNGLGISIEELEDEEDGRIKRVLKKIKLLKPEEQQFVLNMVNATVTEIIMNRK